MRLQQLLALCFDGSLQASESRAGAELAITFGRRRFS
jgi:hypothetical protein